MGKPETGSGGRTWVDSIAWFAGRPAALVLLGAWAGAEAVLLPIVPDVGLCLLALAAPRRSIVLFGAVVIGAALGTIALGGLMSVEPGGTQAAIRSLPGIDQPLVAEARRAVSEDGVLGFIQVGVVPPLKLYASEWFAQGGDAVGAVIGALVNRLTRIGPLLAASAVIGVVLGKGLRRHAAVGVAAYVGAWIVVYTAFWT
jgi:hypothetical protein